MKSLLLLTIIGLTAGRLLAADSPLLLDILPEDTHLLFQGDSITDGNRGRNQDPNHILGHGYVFLIGARNCAALPERNFTFINRGISGNTVQDLAKRWRQDTLDIKPDLLSILIGVNDAGRKVPIEEYERVCDHLLTDARTANPKVRLVLCEPFTLPVGSKKEGYEAWRADIGKRQEVVARLATKHGAALVRFQKVFDDACKRAAAGYWIWDGVHPTCAGHQLMADEWVRAVRAYWSERPSGDRGRGK